MPASRYERICQVPSCHAPVADGSDYCTPHTARRRIQEADALRARAQALESIRRGIRLGGKPLRLRDRIFSSGGGSAEELTPAETSELYAWAGDKIAEVEAEATRLDATVHIDRRAAEPTES